MTTDAPKKRRGRPPKAKAPPLGANGLAPDDQRRLTAIVARVEALLDDRDVIDADIAVVMSEAAAYNFHKPTINALIRERRKPAERRQLLEDLRDSYRHALGMLADTPLGRSALVRQSEAARAAPAPGPDPAPLTRAAAAALADQVFAVMPGPSAAELAGQAADDMAALRASVAPEPSSEAAS